MKRSRFTDDQIIGIVKEHETGISVADLCRKHGVSGCKLGNRAPNSRRMPPVAAKAAGISPRAARAHHKFGMVRTRRALATNAPAAAAPLWRVTRTKAALIGTMAIRALIGKAGAKGSEAPVTPRA